MKLSCECVNTPCLCTSSMTGGLLDDHGPIAQRGNRRVQLHTKECDELREKLRELLSIEMEIRVLRLCAEDLKKELGWGWLPRGEVP